VIAFAVALGVVGCAAAFVALRLGERFLVWAAAHEETRRTHTLTARVEAAEQRLGKAEVDLEKVKAENRVAAMNTLGVRR
jgi:hypothetical protein